MTFFRDLGVLRALLYIPFISLIFLHVLNQMLSICVILNYVCEWMHFKGFYSVNFSRVFSVGSSKCGYCLKITPVLKFFT